MFPFLKNLFNRRRLIPEEQDSMKKYLITGLGNIGNEYVNTRHNIGFLAMDALSKKLEFSFETQKLGDVGVFKIKGRTILALKPSTFMNRSGKALKYWMEKERIPLNNILVITDDINLPFGTLRLKTKGSDGGHNGLRDIQEVLQTNQYNRLRFGIGSEFRQGNQVDYVLGQWSTEETGKLPERLNHCNEIVESFVLAGVQRTMNEFNGT